MNHWKKNHVVTVLDNCENGFLGDLEKADVVYCDWATGLTSLAVGGLRFLYDDKNPTKRPRVIVRARRFELYSQKMINAIDWSMVDEVVFNTEFLKLLAYKYHGKENFLDGHVIPNGVDASRWKLDERRHGDKIAMVAIFNQRKNVPLALHFFSRLPDNYTLHFGGPWKCPATRLYCADMINLLGIAGRVTFDDGLVDVDDFLEDKNYLLQTSISEGVSNIVLEAMAKGVKPLIHSSLGQKGLYMDELMFNDFNEFNNLITGASYDSARYRKFVEVNYSRADSLAKMDALLRPSGDLNDSA